METRKNNPVREDNLRTAANLVRYGVSRRKSIFLIGSPGIGKSAIFAAVARELGLSLRVWEGVSLDPTDVRGVLVPDGSGSSVFTRSPLLPDPTRDGERGIILIDDLPGASLDVQKALYPLFHPADRRVGEHRLPDGWVPAATGNRASDSAGATQVLTALADRALVINVGADLDVWRQDFAIPARIHPLVIGYLGFRPAHFCTFELRRRDRIKDFATPRGWAEVSDVLYGLDEGILPAEDLRSAVEGYVGESVAVEFTAYIKVRDKIPNVSRIFDGDYVVPDEPSVTYAFIGTLVNALVSGSYPGSRKQAVERVLEYSLRLDATFGGMLLRDIYKEFRNEITKSPLWREIAKRYLSK